MIGTLWNRLYRPSSVFKDGDSLLLTRTEFNREISRERIRATRRSIPFCILTIDLTGGNQIRRQRRLLVRMLHRNVRLTDQKADLGSGQFGVLLVDTPEMGGRSVLDRLSGLCDERNIHARLSLRVHDPDGFDSDGFDPDNEIDRTFPNGSGKRRRDEDSDPEPKWLRVDRSVSADTVLAVAHAKAEPFVHPHLNRHAPASTTSSCVTSGETLVEKPRSRRMMKRSIDVIGAAAGLFVSSPLIIAGAIAVRMTSPGPAFFRQTREGMGGKPFTIYKMRTMEVDAESKQAELHADNHRDGPAFKIKHDPRVTRIGSFLRKTCLDELPQFFNVIRGEMSLVGPRPLPWHESRACNHWHRRRLDVPPGMTCYWQVDKAAAESFDDWMRMDLRYVDRNNLWEDLRLIARTAIVPLTGRGSE